MEISDFKLERYFAKYEFNVKYLLCTSDCESIALKDIIAFEPEAGKRLNNLWLGYTESAGSPALRKEIAGIYENISPNQVLVHNGAEEAIFLFMHAMLSYGDHVIVQMPCYQSLFEVAKSIGCQITGWNAREENGWALDIDELKSLIKLNTKAVIINSPNNPTGYLFSRDEFELINRLVEEKGIILFSDEVYRESEYDLADRVPAACDLGSHAVSLGVMSKTYGLAGLRIGWIATSNAEIYSNVARLKDYTTICNSAPSELIAEIALHHRQKLIERSVGIITRNLAILDEFFKKHNNQFTWCKPKAGPITFPKLIGEDIEQFCDGLVKTQGVLLLPGTMYNDSENHFRLGFGRDNMPEAVQHLEEYLHNRDK